MPQLWRVVIGSFWIVLAATAAQAQQSGSTETETVTIDHDRNRNGATRVSEKVVTRTTQGKDSEEVVIETYWPTVYADRLALRQRVRRVTTVTGDVTQTVEETEETPGGSPHEPMRVVRRSVATVRRIGPDSYLTEEQVFERDVNGRFVPVGTQIERARK